MAKTRTNRRDRMLLEGARQACLKAAADAYEDAGIRGLCGDGRWEYALGAIRTLDLEGRNDMKIERGGRVPDIVVRDVDGAAFAYESVWQRRNLLLVTLASEAGADGGAEAAYVNALRAHDETFQEYESAVVITRDAVAGLPPPALLVADRWGEIVRVAYADGPAGLPPVTEVLEWLRFVAHACPECEGEAR